MAESKRESSLNFQLQLSMNRNHTEEADDLILRGADPHVIDTENFRTLLHDSAYFGNIVNMEWLVQKYGLDVMARDYFNNTPAHLAALLGSYDAIIWLAKHGADLEAKNNDGLTVSEVLAEHRYPELAQNLVRYVIATHYSVTKADDPSENTGSNPHDALI